MAVTDLFSKRNIALGTAALSFPPTIYFLYSNSSGSSDKNAQVLENLDAIAQNSKTENSTNESSKVVQSNPVSKKASKSSTPTRFRGLVPTARASAKPHKEFNDQEVANWKRKSSHGAVSLDWDPLDEKDKFGYQNVFAGGRIFNPLINDDSYIKTLDPYDLDDFTNEATPKEVSEEDAKKVIDTLKDYTVYLNQNATGWILDYEIPTNVEDYPTRWFIVTAAHTIVNMCFGEDTYEQHVHLKQYLKSCSGSSIDLYKYTGDDYVDYDDWSPTSSSSEWTRPNDSDKLKHEFVQWNKLIYVPKNLFGVMFRKTDKKNSKDKKVWADEGYMVDMAVIEVNFKDKGTAEKMTNSFYTNYHDKPNKTRINFFADEPKLKGGCDENFFSVGRPDTQTDKEKIVSNYSKKNKKAGKLVGKAKHSSREKIWNQKKNLEFGIRYELNTGMPEHAAGALAVDSKLNVLGMMVYKPSKNDKKSYYVPLRHSGIRSPDYANLFETPKYDLILGADGQIGSYREQLEKYLPEVNTFLSNEWKTKETLKTKISSLKTYPKPESDLKFK